MPRENDDLLIDVDLPPGLTMSFDADGLPKTDLIMEDDPEAKKAEAKKEDDPKPPTLAELDALRAERDAERERAAKAEREANERGTALEAERTKIADLDQKLSKSQTQTLDAHYKRTLSDYQAHHSNYQQIVGAIASAEHLATSLEQQAIAAEEAGDKAKAIRLGRELARAEAHLAQLEAGKAPAEQAVRQAKYDFEEADRVIRAPVKDEPKKDDKDKAPQEAKKDPAPAQLTPEQWIDNAKQVVGDEGAKWLNEHKDYVTDKSKNDTMLAFANYYANKHGQSALKTPAFIKALNNEFFPAKEADVAPDNTEDEEEEVVTTEPKRVSHGAPVSRASNPAGNGGGGGQGKVRLNQLEQATAVQMYPNMDRNAAIKKYAANKAMAMAEGKYK